MKVNRSSLFWGILLIGGAYLLLTALRPKQAHQ
jgi:hypothetical protein